LRYSFCCVGFQIRSHANDWRYSLFGVQSLAMPFMLASGWVLSAVEANPTETRLIIQSLILIGLVSPSGLEFFLSTLDAQLSAEKPPFIVGFVLLLFNTATLILVIRYLDGFVWLRDDARIFIVLRFMGIVMLSSSALQFLVEKNIFKTTAFIVSYETGLSLIALSLNQVNGWNSFVLMFIPRILSIVLWVFIADIYPAK
jgi:phosphoglycerol transferase MdoB-like AlkP superfamily enzyme